MFRCFVLLVRQGYHERQVCPGHMFHAAGGCTHVAVLIVPILHRPNRNFLGGRAKSREGLGSRVFIGGHRWVLPRSIAAMGSPTVARDGRKRRLASRTVDTTGCNVNVGCESNLYQWGSRTAWALRSATTGSLAVCIISGLDLRGP